MKNTTASSYLRLTDAGWQTTVLAVTFSLLAASAHGHSPAPQSPNRNHAPSLPVPNPADDATGKKHKAKGPAPKSNTTGKKHKAKRPAPRTNVFGKSLGEWMELYWISRQGGETEDHGKKVVFLPRQPRVQDPDCPSLLVGVGFGTLRTGEKFVMPGPAIYGQSYVTAPDDDPADAPAAWFTNANMLVKLDGKVVIDSDVDNLNRFYYFEYFPTDILYEEIEENGAIGNIWVTGLGALHGPLPKGEHTLTIYSELRLSLVPGIPGEVYPTLDTYYITVE
jgi:hypothetical protein